MMVVCKDYLDRIRASERIGFEAAAAVEADVTALLDGKSYDHLVVLQKQIQAKLTSGEPVDTDYWEGLIKKLLVWKAKVLNSSIHNHISAQRYTLQAKLKALHEVVVRNRLEQLRKRQRDEALQAQEELLAGVARSASGKHGTPVPIQEITVIEPEPSPEEQVEPYDRSMSPALIDITKLPPEERQIDILTTMEDRRALVSAHTTSLKIHLILRIQYQLRRAVAATRFVAKATPQSTEVEDIEAPSGADLASEALYRAEAEKDLDEEEELFNLEENIVNPTTYNWEDKYRPRKPRYFNRVHTGYEWNKYNQTHYEYVLGSYLRVNVLTSNSTDNPPPKVVQGYKVNLSYVREYSL
jgi:hypothetical protein